MRSPHGKISENDMIKISPDSIFYENTCISGSAHTYYIGYEKEKKGLADQDNAQEWTATAAAATSTAAAAADHGARTCWHGIIDIFHRSSCPQFLVHFHRFHAFTWLYSSYTHLSFVALYDSCGAEG